AEAICVKDGLIQYVGSADIARSMCDEKTEIIDFGNNSIYPGFMEAHCHPMGAGKMLDRDAIADVSAGENLEEYVEIMKAFVEAHPGRARYVGTGFKEREVQPNAAMLDALGVDAAIMIMSVDGHSAWLNTKALEAYNIGQNAIDEWGTDQVRVDAEGKPTGYVSEGPVFYIRAVTPPDPEMAAKALLKSQEFFFSKGYTAIYDAGLELVEKTALESYDILTKSGDLKLRTYVGSLIDENCEDIPAAVENIAAMQKEHNSEYFKIIGVKSFTDGVIEAHTGLLMEDYDDSPGYKGVARMHEHDKLVQLYTKAAECGMNVHVHTVGDGAIHVNLDAIEEVAAKTGLMNQRNVLAHLQLVKKEDIKRFADLNVMAAVAPLWAPKNVDYFRQEVEYVGSERAEGAYPIKSFFEAGANVVYHTDFPVSPLIGVANAVYTGEKRKYPADPDTLVRASDEFVSRYQSLCAMTKNVAYMWHEEDRLGTLENGKVANMSVFDKDFLLDDIEEVGKAEVVCTIVDGDIVYKA
ncbi:MAG: amidohydrolase, partial [Lachnospiraceae bacterium]|nr:amidohydrolase [Candidatus Equihabitans merdae]